MLQGHVFADRLHKRFLHLRRRDASALRGRRAPLARAADVRVGLVQQEQWSAVRWFLSVVTGGGTAGGPPRTALLLPGRPRAAVIAAVADCRRRPGQHVDGGRGWQGGGGLHSSGVGRQRSSTSHSAPIQVWGCRAHQCDPLDSGGARGVAVGGSCRTWFSLDLPYYQAEGSTPSWPLSGRIWIRWPADCLSCQPTTASSCCATSWPRHVWSTIWGRRHARAARSSGCTTRCCGQPCPQPSTWTCRMRDSSNIAASTMGGIAGS